MRVISGKAKGIQLISPKDLIARPTLDRIKEDVFNIIQMNLLEINFLDVFAGSGGIGIEALSRGAKEVVFIEKNKEMFNIIKSNLKKTNLETNSKIINKDSFLYLDQINQKFNIIFLDPPYNLSVESFVKKIILNNLLHKNGIIVVEQDIKNNILEFENLKAYKIKKYKNTQIIFYVLII